MLDSVLIISEANPSMHRYEPWISSANRTTGRLFPLIPMRQGRQQQTTDRSFSRWLQTAVKNFSISFLYGSSTDSRATVTTARFTDIIWKKQSKTCVRKRKYFGWTGRHYSWIDDWGHWNIIRLIFLKTWNAVLAKTRLKENGTAVLYLSAIKS